ncbi:MAG: Ku protein [Acidimicrobiia bacterium]|nr:Ku protein [Acidimicrobiia bacterium]
MATTIWSGSISFGLVTVPVKLTPATQSKDVKFNQLDSESGSRVRYKRMAEATGEVVDQSRIVKGYEMSPGQYVVIEPDELKAMAPKSSRSIEIEEFVDLDEIDPLLFDSPYYLQPDPQAMKPYLLLVEAMAESNKVAIGRIVMRTKESLVAIRSLDGMLVVETMRYADEVLPARCRATPMISR